MAYKFTTGSIHTGDIIYEDDSGHEQGAATYIDFGYDSISLRPATAETLKCAPGQVVITGEAATPPVHTDAQLKLAFDAGDYAFLGVDANGALTIETVDSDGVLADIILNPDGVFTVFQNKITSLQNDTGCGEIVFFGTEDDSDTLAAGKLMYLATDGDWKYADADAVATSGPVLLGIALGDAMGTGILIRGYFDCATIQGSFAKGAACYISETAGVIDFTAPSAGGDVVRVVGHGTDTANIIYFNPSPDWIEL